MTWIKTKKKKKRRILAERNIRGIYNMYPPRFPVVIYKHLSIVKEYPKIPLHPTLLDSLHVVPFYWRQCIGIDILLHWTI